MSRARTAAFAGAAGVHARAAQQAVLLAAEDAAQDPLQPPHAVSITTAS